MKFIVAMQNKLSSLRNQAIECCKQKEGQTTVEYIMIIGIVIVVAGVVMVAMKNMMPEVFESVKAKILGGLSKE